MPTAYTHCPGFPFETLRHLNCLVKDGVLAIQIPKLCTYITELLVTYTDCRHFTIDLFIELASTITAPAS